MKRVVGTLPQIEAQVGDQVKCIANGTETYIIEIKTEFNPVHYIDSDGDAMSAHMPHWIIIKKNSPINHEKQFVEYLEGIVEGKRTDAAFNGEHSDGGAGALEEQINVWNAARANVIPDSWKRHYKMFSRGIDPEYKEYQRLKEKFE